MAVRELDGIDDDIQMAVGTLSGMAYGTVAILLKRTATGNYQSGFLTPHTSGGTAQWTFGFASTDAAYMWTNAQSDGPVVSNTTNWHLVVCRKSTGTVAPRWSILNLTTGIWTHGAGSVALADGGAPGVGGTLRFAWSGTELLDARVAVRGAKSNVLIWAADTTGDAQIEAAGLEDSLQKWIDAGFDSVWAFNQASISTPVEDLVGTADQTAITGTTVITGDDPPGFSFSLGTAQAGSATLGLVTAHSSIVDAVIADADWILTAKIVDASTPGQSGALGNFPDAPPTKIRPYQANLACIGLARATQITNDFTYVDAAWDHLTWYQSRMDGTTGYVNDYDWNGSAWVSPTNAQGEPYDSTDAYAATALLALRACWRADPDTTRLDDYDSLLSLAYTAINSTVQPSGLPNATPLYHAALLLDVSEVIAGLWAGRELARLRNNTTLAHNYTVLAESMTTAANDLLWDTGSSDYDVARNQDTGINDEADLAGVEFHAMGQAWAVWSGLAQAGGGTTREDDLMTAIESARPDWETTGSFDAAAITWGHLVAGTTSTAIAEATTIRGRSGYKAWPCTPMAVGEVIVAISDGEQIIQATSTFAEGGTSAISPNAVATDKKVAALSGRSSLGLAARGTGTKLMSVTGIASLGLTATPDDMRKVAPEIGRSALSLTASSTGAIIRSQTGVVSLGTTATGIEKRVMSQSGTAVLGLSGTRAGTATRAVGGTASLGFVSMSSESRIATQGGRADVGLVSDAIERKVVPQAGRAIVGLATTAVEKHVAIELGVSALGFVAQGTAAKQIDQAGQVALTLTATYSGVVSRPLDGVSSLGLVARSVEVKIGVETGRASLGLVVRSLQARIAGPSGVTTIGLVVDGAVVRIATANGVTAFGMTSTGGAGRTIQVVAIGMIGLTGSGAIFNPLTTLRFEVSGREPPTDYSGREPAYAIHGKELGS